MSRTLTFELDDTLYEVLQGTAKQWGRPLEDVALEFLSSTAPKARPQLSKAQHKAALTRLLRHAGAVNSGDRRASDNEQIEALLAREYSSAHEEES